jgi:hypothetical protein
MKTLALAIALIALMSPIIVAPASTRAQNGKETPSTPPAVSPARPDIPSPRIDDPLYCWRCGAPYPYTKKHHKDPMHRPMLAPGAESPQPVKSAFQRGVRMVPAEFVLRQAQQLQLSESQVSRLEDLVYETKAQLIDLSATFQKEELRLQQIIRSDEDDISLIKRQLEIVADARVAVQTERLSSWLGAKKILNVDQRKSLKESTYWRWPIAD